MSPRKVQPARSSQRSVAKIFPSTVPCTVTVFDLTSPLMDACSPIVSVPVDLISPFTSPSIRSWSWNLTEPVIETPRDRIPPDRDRKSTRLNSSHTVISYAVFCLKKKNELKVLTSLSKADKVQMVNYLTAPILKGGLRLNYGRQRIQINRQYRRRGYPSV